MDPPGANLNFDQLINAMKWKLEAGQDSTMEIPHSSDGSERNLNRNEWCSRWSKRADEVETILRLMRDRASSKITNGFYPWVSHAAVERLPPEILAEIFLWLKHGYPTTSFDLPVTIVDVNDLCHLLVNITHVCRSWRFSAHSCKALWSHNVSGDKLKHPGALAKHFLALSDPLPIILDHQFDPLLPPSEELSVNEFYLSIMQKPERISAMNLRGYFPEVAWQLLAQHLPNLVELQLFFQRLDGGMGEPARDGVVEGLLNGKTSSLQKLHLGNCAWPEQAFTSLTHLYLTETTNWMVRYDDFIRILESLSPSLQVLHVGRDAGPWVETAHDDVVLRLPHERVRMVSLCHVEVFSGQDPGQLLLFLEDLFMPSIKTMLWDCDLTEAYLSHFSDDGWSNIPPAKDLEPVRNLIGWAPRKGCYTISNNSLYFDPGKVDFTALESWPRFLPNLQMVALPDELVCHLLGNGSDPEDFTHVKFVHLGSYIDFVEVMTRLEREEPNIDPENPTSPFLPSLQSLTVHTGDQHCDPSSYFKSYFEEKLEYGNEDFEQLPPLRLSSKLTTERQRPHMQSTYTLSFKPGTIDGLLYEPSSD